MSGPLDAISDYFTSSPSEGGGDSAPAPVQDGGGGSGIPAAPAAAPSLSAQAAQIQAAIAKLSAGQGTNDPMMYFQAAAGLGAPTQSGSFFEGLGKMNKNVGDYMMANRDLQMKGLGAQAQLLGMQADLSLKEMQAKMQAKQIEGMDAMSTLSAGAAGTAKGGAKALGTVIGSSAPGAAAPAVDGAPAAAGEPAADPIKTFYDNVSLPPALAAQTQRFTDAVGSKGITPLYDLGKLIESAKFAAATYARTGYEPAQRAAEMLNKQISEFLKEGYMPALDASGQVTKQAIPGHLQSIYDKSFQESQGQLPAEREKIALTGAETRKTNAAQVDNEVRKENLLIGTRAQAEIEKDIAKDFAKDLSAMRAEAESAVRAQAALEAMRNAHPKVYFGNGADAKLWAAKLAEDTIGIGAKDRIMASEEFDKNAAVLAAELGSRGTGSDAHLANATKANPSRALSSAGAKEIMDAATLRNQRLIDKANAATEWFKKNGDLLGFAQQFEKDFPTANYIVVPKAKEVKGQPVLPSNAQPLPPGFR